MQVVEKRVLSCDKEHMLAGRVYVPDGDPRGLFQVVHGMTEHIARYDRFMREMAADGYICFGYDHLGHGHTARDDSELGFIAHRDGWKKLVRDVAVFSDAVREEYGKQLPYVLLGHSMGSFIVRLAAVSAVRPDALIVMGTGGPNPAAGVGLAVIRAVKLLRGEKAVSPLIGKLAFGSYNQRFASGSPYSWLTKDAAVWAAYGEDKYCSFPFTVSAMQDLVMLNRESNSRRFFRGLDRRIPVLLVSGQDDPVGDYGKGVETVYRKLRAAGVTVERKIYADCRHEILNDTCRSQVLEDIRAFCRAKIAAER